MTSVPVTLSNWIDLGFNHYNLDVCSIGVSRLYALVKWLSDYGNALQNRTDKDVAAALTYACCKMSSSKHPKKQSVAKFFDTTTEILTETRNFIMSYECSFLKRVRDSWQPKKVNLTRLRVWLPYLYGVYVSTDH